MNNKDNNNLFIGLPAYKLHELWIGYKKVAEDKCYSEDNLMTPYKEQYVNKFGPLGIMMCELDFLKAVAYRYFEG